jgi:hypothetical protein
MAMKVSKSRIAIAVLLLLAINTPLHAATPKAGAKCTKAGATSTSGGKKFTCIKSGTKLVWNKGVEIKAAAPKPTPSPPATATPTPTPTPTVKVEEPVGRWQDTQFGIVKALSALTPATVQKLNFVYSPNVNKSEADKLQASYQEPISLLSNLYVNPRPVTFLVMSETERDWWWSQASLLATKMPDDWWGGSHCQPNPMAHCGYGSMVEPDGTFHFGQLLGSRFVWQFNDYAISYHESIHVYQLGLMGNRMTALPFWFAEGQANYFGYAFSHKFYSSEVQRRNTLRDLRSKFPNLAGFNQSQWVEWLNKVDQDSQFTFNNGLGYSVGELILESLYNEHDYRKIHEWMLNIKNGDNYKDAFKKVFGQDYGLWMDTVVAPYLDSQI